MKTAHAPAPAAKQSKPKPALKPIKPPQREHSPPTTDGVYRAAFARLQRIADGREKAKAREQDLVKERKELDSRMDDMGAGETPEHLRVRSRYVVVKRAIDYFREKLATLADRSDETIRQAGQGKLFEDRDNVDIVVKDPAESDLFHVEAEEDDDDEQPKLPGIGAGGKGGKSGKRSRGEDVPAGAPVGTKPLDYSGWRGTLRKDERDIGILAKRGVPDKAVAALRRAGLTELRSLCEPLPEASPGSFGRLTTIHGVTPSDEVVIETAVNELAEEVESEQDARLRGGPAPAGEVLLKLPGRFRLKPLGARGRKAVEFDAGDEDALDAKIREAMGGAEFELRGGKVLTSGPDGLRERAELERIGGIGAVKQ